MSGFGAQSTAAEVVQGLDLAAIAAVVTGGASGIGMETARALAAAGARVTLAVRDVTKGNRVADELRAGTGNDAVDVRPLDLADLASVDAFVAAWDGPLDVLVANAGVMRTPEVYTAEGWELQFASNHLGHFALAVGLRPALAAGPGGRVVVVSSSGHDASPVVFDDLFFQERAYDPGLAYGQSKTANVLFAVEATRRWAQDGISVNALMPGGVWTNLQRHWDPEDLAQAKAAAAGTGATKTPEQGAATSVLLATSPDLATVSGRYFEDCHEAEVVDAITDGLHGVRDYALDPAAAERLWDVSTALLSAARRASHRAGEDVVRTLIGAIEQRRSPDAKRLLAGDAVFDNGPAGTFTGPEAIVATIDAVSSTMERVDWRLVRTASAGSTVFTERVDRFCRGGVWAEIPVVGVFEVADGQVTSWRDYYNAGQGSSELGALPDA